MQNAHNFLVRKSYFYCVADNVFFCVIFADEDISSIVHIELEFSALYCCFVYDLTQLEFCFNIANFVQRKLSFDRYDRYAFFVFGISSTSIIQAEFRVLDNLTVNMNISFIKYFLYFGRI